MVISDASLEFTEPTEGKINICNLKLLNYSIIRYTVIFKFLILREMNESR